MHVARISVQSKYCALDSRVYVSQSVELGDHKASSQPLKIDKYKIR
jgi:hypothetical protein